MSSQERFAALVVYDDALLCEQGPTVPDVVTHDVNAEETVLESWHTVDEQVGRYPVESDLALCC